MVDRPVADFVSIWAQSYIFLINPQNNMPKKFQINIIIVVNTTIKVEIKPLTEEQRRRRTILVFLFNVNA